MMMVVVPTFAVTTAHPFVLTVSHGLLFRQPLLSATARLPPLLSIHPKSITSAERRTKISSQCSAPILFSPDIRLDSCFRRPPTAVTTPANRAFPRPFGRGVQNSSRRASHDCLRAEPMKRHDLSTI
ncbi:MAG TPA: hypothetical protein VGV62_09690 [Xanthobacteraceae bacterium]|jgi:hypothetical protein|nr:hypothetical protein [Xanthobacteraceae bacterium]